MGRLLVLGCFSRRMRSFDGEGEQDGDRRDEVWDGRGSRGSSGRIGLI